MKKKNPNPHPVDATYKIIIKSLPWAGTREENAVFGDMELKFIHTPIVKF